jgi:Nucleotidyl transferase AbiEii toxin, Type IV TA system
VPVDVAASVFDRLKRSAREAHKDFNLVLDRYAAERLLYRLSCSGHADSFLLKGAMLFAVWEREPHRPTRDIDLLGFGEDSEDCVRSVFVDVCETPVEDDGVVFDPASVAVTDIRQALRYQGKRARVDGRLGTARLRCQIDVGFGDTIVGAAPMIVYPTLLDQPAPRLRAYSAVAVIAEKLHGVVEFGMDNSRMKDFYDLQMLPQHLAFGGDELVAAIAATFARRSITLGTELPVGLTREFAEDAAARTRWKAFADRNHLDALGLNDAVAGARRFLQEPVAAVAAADRFAKRWPAGGPWT